MNQSINTDSKNSKEPQQKYRLGTVSIKEVDEVIFCLENSSLLVATSEVAFVRLVTGIFDMPCSCVVFDKLSFSVGVVLFFVIVVLPAVKAGASVVCNNPFILVVLPPAVGDATFIAFSVVFTGPTVVLMDICNNPFILVV